MPDGKTRVEFDAKAVIAAVRRGSMRPLYRAGGYVRKAARNQVHKSKKASAPGTPPNTRCGLLRRSLLFGVDRERLSVVIGPARQFIGLAMTAHEFGIRYRGRKYPKRALMRPVLKQTAGRLPKLWEDSMKP